MQAVEGFSHGYVEGNAWRTPLSWAGKDKWIVVAYLKGICKVSANEVTSTLSVAFGVAVVEHGGGVAYEPTKADLEHYFIPLARAKDSKGWLAGVPYGPRAKERPLRLLYLAPRVVALLHAPRGALKPLALEAYDLAIGADNKAHGSAQKCVLKAEYSALAARFTEIEMEVDDAREAADEQSSAANQRGKASIRSMGQNDRRRNTGGTFHDPAAHEAYAALKPLSRNCHLRVELRLRSPPLNLNISAPLSTRPNRRAQGAVPLANTAYLLRVRENNSHLCVCAHHSSTTASKPG